MKISLLSALIALSLAVPAIAKEQAPVFVETVAVKDKPAVALDATKAYVMLRSDMAVSLYLMKVPTADDQGSYDKFRADALAKAHEKYVKKQAQYDAAVKDRASAPKGSALPPLPDKPIEPTEANFQFTPFPLLAGVSIGPINRFAKAEGGLSTYLQELTPGEYRIYGPLAMGPNGAIGSCFCMGSVAFAAKAGEIVDLGVIAAKANLTVKRPEGDSSAPIILDGPFLVPAGASVAVDARLSGAHIVAARFRPVGKLPNYFGVTINRMPVIPGVMRYDRDRIVDLTAAN
ncbi:hypothetical protein [Sphingomonas asaccharolytica]|uniref:hypothetical protein n=1 Tax=Sphingomonas asaccharolytica TaxID=40681 RepID=UPI00082FD479|nr:hypothetical protein [Sphingomonas asaccharolytica]